MGPTLRAVAVDFLMEQMGYGKISKLSDQSKIVEFHSTWLDFFECVGVRLFLRDKKVKIGGRFSEWMVGCNGWLW